MQLRTPEPQIPNHHKQLLVLDTETSGLSSTKNKTLTVGLLLASFKKSKPKILDENHIFIRHDNYNANPFALRINKINLEQHHKIGILPKTACQKINKFIIQNDAQKTPLLGHNIGFDKKFLTALYCQGNCNPIFHEESIDTLQIWRSLQKKELIPPHLSGRLSSVANHFNIDSSSAHDALADCHITAQIYHKMLKLQK